MKDMPEKSLARKVALHEQRMQHKQIQCKLARWAYSYGSDVQIARKTSGSQNFIDML